MGTYRKGRPDDCFEDRCIKQSVSRICECMGDRLLVDGERGCYVWNRAHFKHDDVGPVEISDSEIKIYWPSCEYRNIKCGSSVERKGKWYNVSVDPQDLHNGWMCAELDYCGLC